MADRYTLDEISSSLEKLIEDASDSGEQELFEYALRYVDYEDRLWKSGMRWDKAQAEARREFPRLYDTEGDWRIQINSRDGVVVTPERPDREWAVKRAAIDPIVSYRARGRARWKGSGDHRSPPTDIEGN